MIEIKGHIKIYNKNKLIYEKNNLVVDDGLEQVIALLEGTSVIPIDGIEIGDSNTPAVETQTTLISPLSDLKSILKSSTGNVLTCIGGWFAGEATGTWAELGLWTGVWSDPTTFIKHKLISRVVLDPVVVKAAGTELSVNWTITAERKVSE
jgi:hypothetical protein